MSKYESLNSESRSERKKKITKTTHRPSAQSISHAAYPGNLKVLLKLERSGHGKENVLHALSVGARGKGTLKLSFLGA